MCSAGGKCENRNKNDSNKDSSNHFELCCIICHTKTYSGGVQSSAHTGFSPLCAFFQALREQQWNPPTAELHGIQLYGTLILLLGPHPRGSSLLPPHHLALRHCGGKAAIPLPLTPEQQDPLREKIKKRRKGENGRESTCRAYRNCRVGGNDWGVDGQRSCPEMSQSIDYCHRFYTSSLIPFTQVWN